MVADASCRDETLLLFLESNGSKGRGSILGCQPHRGNDRGAKEELHGLVRYTRDADFDTELETVGVCASASSGSRMVY